MAVSSNSMNVARVTVIAISQGLMAFVWSKLVESATVVAAILASCSTQMAAETDRSQINRRNITVCDRCNCEENASWRETALAGTYDCSDSGRRNRGIDGLVSVPRRGERGGSNPLSTSIAGEDELNDDGFR